MLFLTRSSYTGVMKLVGKAIREHTLRSRKKIYALGVASWGIIDNQTDLIYKPPGVWTYSNIAYPDQIHAY